jgi:hypothetical protein
MGVRLAFFALACALGAACALDRDGLFAGGQAGAGGAQGGAGGAPNAGGTMGAAGGPASSSTAGGSGPGLLGSTCSRDNECKSDQCVDGVCCNSDCTGECEMCLEAHTGEADGNCAPIIAEQDPDDECPPFHTCNGAGDCELALGSVCSDDRDCVSGECTDGHCCNEVCDGECEACSQNLNNVDDGQCAPIPLGDDPGNECSGAASTCDGTGQCN